MYSKYKCYYLVINQRECWDFMPEAELHLSLILTFRALRLVAHANILLLSVDDKD